MTEKPARIEVEPGFVAFPKTLVGQETVASVRLANVGEAVAELRLSIPPPFTLSSTAITLPPGAEHTVQLGLEPVKSGITGGVLLVEYGVRWIEIAVMAEAQAPPTGP